MSELNFSRQESQYLRSLTPVSIPPVNSPVLFDKPVSAQTASEVFVNTDPVMYMNAYGRIVPLFSPFHDCDAPGCF